MGSNAVKTQPELELRALDVFVTVVEAGGMTHAARRLGTTQPAVSQTIANLEAGLGVTLIDRSVRPLKLTTQGGILYERAKLLLAEARDAVRAVSDPGRQALPLVRVGLVDTFAATVAPHLIEALRPAAVQWSVRSGLSPDHEQALLAREADVIVVGEVMEDTPGLERHQVLAEPFFLAVPAAFEGPLDDLAALAGRLDLVRFSNRSFFGRRVEQHLRRIRVEPTRRLEFDTADAVMAMVGAGIGWAIMTPLCLLQGIAYAGRIRCLPLPGPGFGRRLTLIARQQEFGDLPGRIAEAAAEVLRERCLPAIAEHAAFAVAQMRVGDSA
jgi:DNA-binding transcriptional LysR family regulator